MSRVLAKVAYKPVGLALGATAGAISGVAFRRIWRGLSGSDRPPDRFDENTDWVEVLLAATLQGAIFALVRAAADRAAVVGVRKAVGDWPH
jgi:hypothetical protein